MPLIVQKRSGCAQVLRQQKNNIPDSCRPFVHLFFCLLLVSCHAEKKSYLNKTTFLQANQGQGQNALCDILGDLNADEALNILDIVILANIILGTAQASECADITVDGEINILDIVVVMNTILDCPGGVEDDCGVCGGDNSSCADCAGEPNGSAYTDACGTCDADSTNDCSCDISPGVENLGEEIQACLDEPLYAQINLPGGHYILDSTLSIQRSVSIQGVGTILEGCGERLVHVYLDLLGTVTFRSLIFLGGKSSESGGAIWAGSTELSSQLLFEDTVFTNNSAVNKGGALFAQNMHLVFSASTLMNNQAGVGGAIAQEGGGLSLLGGSLLYGNRALTVGG